MVGWKSGYEKKGCKGGKKREAISVTIKRDRMIKGQQFSTSQHSPQPTCVYIYGSVHKNRSPSTCH